MNLDAFQRINNTNVNVLIFELLNITCCEYNIIYFSFRYVDDIIFPLLSFHDGKNKITKY